MKKIEFDLANRHHVNALSALTSSIHGLSAKEQRTFREIVGGSNCLHFSPEDEIVKTYCLLDDWADKCNAWAPQETESLTDQISELLCDMEMFLDDYAPEWRLDYDCPLPWNLKKQADSHNPSGDFCPRGKCPKCERFRASRS